MQKEGPDNLQGENRAIEGGIREAAVWLLVSVGIFALSCAVPLEGAYTTPSGAVLQGWVSRGVCRCFPLVFTALAAVATLAWFRTASLSGGAPEKSGGRFVFDGLRPLVLLPALVAVRHASAWIGVTSAALAIPLGVPLLLALCAERLTRPLFENRGEGGARFDALSGPLVFALAFLSLFIVHHWQGKDRFAGGGDVCHYLVQTDNLVECGNLDLTERVERWMREANVPPDQRNEYLTYSHMRRNARGRVFSVHGFGWPLLAWPFARVAGNAGISAFCMLLGALGLCGVYLSCLRCRATSASSAVSAAVIGLSWFWNYTALSRLPEMLGCVLCIWAFWAFLALDDPARRKVATATATVCCAYLPVAHMRFFPVAIVLYVAFAVRTLVAGRKNVAHLLAFLFVPLASWGLLWRAHGVMFEGCSSFALSEILMSRPSGILGIFTFRRGAGPIFPLIWIFALAPVASVTSGDRHLRAAAVVALAVEVATLVFCCANHGAFDGACISARYFLQAIPVLVPFGARFLDKCGRAGRSWWFFMASMPILYLFAISPFCSGGGLVRSPYGIWDFDIFRSFWMPFRNSFAPLSTTQAATSLVLPAVLMTVPWLLAGRAPWRLALSAALLLAGVAGGLASTRFLPAVNLPSKALGTSHGWHYFRRIAGPEPASYFEAFKSTRQFSPTTLVVTDKTPEKPSKDILAVSGKESNDWQGRNLHWCTLRRIHSKNEPKGTMAVHVSGNVLRGKLLVSSVLFKWSFLPGDQVFGEGPFDLVLLLPRIHEPVPIYAALLDNVGEARIEVLDILPWAPGLEEAAGPFPTHAVVIDASSMASWKAR